jgi:3-deoxy-D-manno-octulosonic-acid transferase
MDGLLPIAACAAAPVLFFKEKRRATLFPRLGFQSYPKLPLESPRPVWVHALSVGELLSAVPLIRRLRNALDRPLVVSVSTLAAHRLARARLEGMIDGLFYFPLDTAIAYRRCYQHIRPDLFVLVETDVWPGYLSYFRQRGVRCVLVNGRLSPRSFRARQKWWCLFKDAFAAFDRIYGQSPGEVERFRQLGIESGRLGGPGNLKFDACGHPPDAEAVTKQRSGLGYERSDLIVVAGSTHPGEEAVMRRVFLKLRQELAQLKLICVPRHPHRAEEVRALFSADPVRVALFSGAPRMGPDILVVDELGHLGRLYSLAAVAFVGGSLAGTGGQNPIEPAMAGVPVLFGPDMRAFPDVAPQLVNAGSAFQVRDENELTLRCRELLADPDQRRRMGESGRALVSAHLGTADRLAAEIAELAHSDSR